MTIEFVLVDDEKGEYSDTFLTLDMPMPPRVGEWFNGVETTDIVDDFTVKDVSYAVRDGFVSAVVFCEAR
jgi:hypothetical protein